MDSIWQDIRYSWRSLIKSPALSLTIFLTLTLAIGTNTAVFTVLNEVLSKSLPFPESERIVNIVQDRLTITGENYREFVDAMKKSSFFEAVGVTSGVPFGLNNGIAPARVVGLNVTSEVLRVLKIQPELGRFFREDDENQTSPVPIILNYSCWKKRFGGDYKVLHKMVRIEGESAIIIGVMPKSVEKYFQLYEIWLPLNALSRNRPQRRMFLVARLKRGSTIESADAFVKTVTKHMPHAKDYRIRLITMADRIYEFQKESVPVLTLWMGVAGFILIIACANTVNLLLARGSRKEKEIAIRISLGATRMQVIRLMVFESLMLAILGGVGGLILAFWGKDIFGKISFIENASFDFRVL